MRNKSSFDAAFIVQYCPAIYMLSTRLALLDWMRTSAVAADVLISADKEKQKARKGTRQDKNKMQGKTKKIQGMTRAGLALKKKVCKAGRKGKA